MISVDYLQVFKYIEKDEMLSKALKYVIENNPGNLNPYHNLNHELQMCYHILQYKEFDKWKKHLLILAALFHDFAHSAGKVSDEINVNLAIDSVVEYIKHQNTTPALWHEVSEIIRATQYPYVIPDEKLSEEQKIIRDCDLIVRFDSDYFTQAILGLKAESQLDLPTLLAKEKQFINSFIYDMRTDYGKKVIEEHLGSLINYIKVIENIIL